MFLNNTHTLLATLAVSNSSFEQHSHTFGYFCFKKLDRGIKSCPCAAASHLGPILGTILAPKWSPWGSSWRSWAPSWPKMVPLELVLAILGTILEVFLAILCTIVRGILYIHKITMNRKAADTCLSMSFLIFLDGHGSKGTRRAQIPRRKLYRIYT